MKPGPKARSPEERFWSFVSPEPTTGCWLWTGHVQHQGYGRLWSADRQGMILATHVALAIAGRPVPPRMMACHRCDVWGVGPACVNPDHLFVGSNQDNQIDYVAKGLNEKTRRTHCVRGHPLTPANVFLRASRNGRPGRNCRTCNVERASEWRAARRAST